MAATPGPYLIDRIGMPTWLLRFDKVGACTSPQTRAALLAHLEAVDRTDVVFFSHGWNNDFDAAVDLYREFLQHFEALVGAYPPGRPFNPLFVGVIWPSTWLVFDSGPKIAATGSSRADPALETVTAEMAGRLASASAATKLERFYALLEKDRLSGDEAREFSRLVAPAFGSVRDEETGGTQRDASADDVLEMLRAAQSALLPAASAAPDIDAWGTTGEAAAARGGPAEVPSAAGLFDFIDPRSALRLFSLYQMKDRAGTVGFNGVGSLLRDVLAAAPKSKPRVHAVGHSFGCKVMLSAICQPAALPRPVSSLLLLQPAISHLCFAESVPGTQQPGGYRLALDAARVQRPIYSTYSKKDFPLHSTFHLALRRNDDVGEAKIAADVSTSAGEPPSQFAALGGYGPRGAGQKLVEPLPAAGTRYEAGVDAPIVAFDGSRDIINGHGDVKSDAAAWALHQLVFR